MRRPPFAKRLRSRLVVRLIAGASVLAAISSGVLALLLVAVGELRDHSASATRSEAAIAAAVRVERLIVDIETGGRGYIITGRPSFLAPWREGRRQFAPAVARLERLMAGDRQQVARVARIRSRARGYVDGFSPRLVALARADRRRAAARVAGGEGRRRVDSLRRLFNDLLAREATASLDRQARASSAASHAASLALGGLIGSGAILALFVVFLARTVVAPLRRAAGAAQRLGHGDLGVRLPPARGSDEMAQLTTAFNTMADALEDGEEEAQMQHDALERAGEALAREKARLETFHGFGERLTGERGLTARAEAVLGGLADVAGAEVGTLGVLQPDGERVLACRGTDPGAVPGVSAGLAGRAVRERRPVTAVHEDGAALRTATLAGERPVASELHVPLLAGDEPVGVASLGWLRRGGPAPGVVETLERMAEQAAVALADALATEEIRRLAALNRIVLDAARDAIVLIAPDGQATLTNAPAQRLTCEILGLDTFDGRREVLSRVPAMTTDRAGMGRWLERLSARPREESTYTFELASTCRSFTCFAAPAYAHDGEWIGRIIALREVTAERQAEQVKTELVATVSHELRTPLASVLGFAELLLERDVDPAARTAYVQRIVDEGRRLTALVDDFLDLQRLERGDPGRLRPERMELAPLLTEQTALYAAQSDRHELRFEDPGAEAVAVVADRDRIAQVTGNLLSNAIKYSPEGGPVVVDVRRDGGEVVVSVTDTGLGVPEGQRDQLYRRFFRVDSSDTRRIGGTGLGLALVREIVEAHGGRTGFDSVVGRGSRFWFALPAA